MSSKRILVAAAAALVLAVVLGMDGEILGLPGALAQQVGQQARGQLGEPWVSILAMMGGFISFMQVVALITLWVLQYVLSTEFFTDPVMMANLNQIWVLSRDIMNILFALMLIGVAIYTIITANKDQVTTHFVRFATAVVLVNFSWFFPRVIIDVANVLTSTIYSIPNMLPGFTCQFRNDNLDPPLQPCQVVVDVLVLPKSKQQERLFCADSSGAANPQCACFTGLACYILGSYDDADLAPGHAMINSLAISFARINTLAKVPTSITGAPGPGSNQVALSIHLMVSTIMIFVFLAAAILPLIGLAVGMVIRIVILWVTVAFMPFTFIGYVMNGKLGTPFLGEYDIWKNFIDAAFLPTIVAIPFTIGFIMLSSTAQIPGPNDGLIIAVPLVHGVKTWWGMMWLAAAIGIIYTGAFTALKRNQLIGRFVTPIENFGNTLASTASQLPLLVPLPLPGRPTTIGGALNAPRKLETILGAGARE